MKPDCKKTVLGQLSTVDRISELPASAILHILSFLGTREAYRTSILSKRWAHISATNPILEFHCYCKKENSSPTYCPSKEVSARLLKYMHSRMQRYDQKSLRVTTLRLIFPNSEDLFGRDVQELELSGKIDEWIRIAVRNHVEILDLHCLIDYQLPEIFLSAESLRQLDCIGVKIPYYNSAINLASLQTVGLISVDVEERMLNHIINSSLSLKSLWLRSCRGFETIVIPCCSQLKELSFSESLPEDGKIILETSSLTFFLFSDLNFNDRWPVMSNPGVFRNLTALDIASPGITDEDLGILLPELASLESLQLYECYTLTTIRISSIRLKKIYLNDCPNLLEVSIDAPSLTKFKYKGDIDPRATITVHSQASCDIFVDITPVNLDTRGFIQLKELMTGLSNCNALKFLINDDFDQSRFNADVKFVEEELGDVNLGPPRDITELKLILGNWKFSRSSVSALLNGLFWTCHPDIISFRVHLEHPSLMIQFLMTEIENMANCWRHPLKGVEVEGANCLNLLKSKKVDLQLRLHW